MRFSAIYKQLNIKLGEDIKTALDIGSGAGPFSSSFSNLLHENGVVVTALDKEKPNDLKEEISFIQTRFEDFQANSFYDLVHCHHVLPFMENKLTQLQRMLKLGKYVFFTGFGLRDEWKEKDFSLSKEEILEVLSEKEVLYMAEEEFEGLTAVGSMKHWHVYTFFIKT